MVHKLWSINYGQWVMNHGWCQFQTEIEVRNPMKEYWDGDRVSTIRFTLMIILMEKIHRNGMNFTKIIKSANRNKWWKLFSFKINNFSWRTAKNRPKTPRLSVYGEILSTVDSIFWHNQAYIFYSQIWLQYQRSVNFG